MEEKENCNLSVNQLLEKYAAEDSEDDPDFVPSAEQLVEDSSCSSGGSSDDEDTSSLQDDSSSKVHHQIHRNKEDLHKRSLLVLPTF